MCGDFDTLQASARAAQVPDERGIATQYTFVPQYAREHAKLERLRQLAEEGRMTPRVAHIFPAEQAVEAHRLLAAGGLKGRVVLTF
ncbi:zinc-binding dehydrogenase [Streptomyces sp. NBC_00009]|uniref:zinc-binding dehydrogenase n=1 Tax=Streptomyces sp. NBC_00009 TaxID=2975620 RepID=UPI00324F8E19